MTEQNPFRPIEVLIFNECDKLIVLPYGKMKRLKIPFRFDGKWWRRSNTSNASVEIKIVFERKQLIMLDYMQKSWAWNRRTTLFESELIAVFEEFLTNYEKKCGIVKLNMNSDEK
jgi:hypothetical protein